MYRIFSPSKIFLFLSFLQRLPVDVSPDLKRYPKFRFVFGISSRLVCFDSLVTFIMSFAQKAFLVCVSVFCIVDLFACVHEIEPRTYLTENDLRSRSSLALVDDRSNSRDNIPIEFKTLEENQSIHFRVLLIRSRVLSRIDILF